MLFNSVAENGSDEIIKFTRGKHKIYLRGLTSKQTMAQHFKINIVEHSFTCVFDYLTKKYAVKQTM